MRLARWVNAHKVQLATWAVVIVAWEIASALVPASGIHNSPIVPSVQFVWTTAFKSISGSWTLHFWAPVPEDGGAQTYLGALLALVYSSFKTLVRVVLGLAAGTAIGVGSGIVISYSSVARRTIWGPVNFLRVTPLLAATPLFAFWFGANQFGTTVFIAFGVSVLLVVATITAIRNVPAVYAESAWTLGASRSQTYRRVIIPRALPELRTSLLLSAGLSWSLGVASEYLGLPNGLGSIMATAAITANTGRMLVVAFTVMFLALLSFFLLNKLFLRLVYWVPSSGKSAVTLGGGLASAASGTESARLSDD